MNENLNLVEILKNCPRGTKLYSTVFGEVIFDSIKKDKPYPICFITNNGDKYSVAIDGRINIYFYGECTLFPSKNQRDWSKFKPKKNRFDPKTLLAFDKVLVRLRKDCIWLATFFSHYDKEVKWGCYPFVTTGSRSYSECIPYNEDTKHLLGTSDEAPEYYRYWED